MFIYIYVFFFFLFIFPFPFFHFSLLLKFFFRSVYVHIRVRTHFLFLKGSPVTGFAFTLFQRSRSFFFSLVSLLFFSSIHDIIYYILYYCDYYISFSFVYMISCILAVRAFLFLRYIYVCIFLCVVRLERECVCGVWSVTEFIFFPSLFFSFSLF